MKWICLILGAAVVTMAQAWISKQDWKKNNSECSNFLLGGLFGAFAALVIIYG